MLDLMLKLIVIGVFLAGIIYLNAPLAAEPEQLIMDHGSKILDMIGPHGLFAIIGSIAMVRLIRVLWYLDKRQSFLVTLAVSGLIGAASAYFSDIEVTSKFVLGGAFMTMIGTPVAFACLTWAIAFAYQHWKWDVLKRLYFFLSPRPMKIRNGKQTVVVDPDEGLTRFFEKTRIDRRPPPEPERDEHDPLADITERKRRD